MTDAPAVVNALLTQWQLIRCHIPVLDLDRPCRVATWTNRELLAHLAVQPVLLKQFLRTASAESPEFSLAKNLSGTSSLAETIDSSAREAARAGKVRFGEAVDDVRSDLLATDLDQTVRSVQGRIGLRDYLITRCVEAVVHGLDFIPSVPPDPTAEGIVAAALMAVLQDADAGLVAEARRLPVRDWIDMATGRATAPPSLSAALPLMQ